MANEQRLKVIRQYRVRPGGKVHLERIDPEDTSVFSEDKDSAVKRFEHLKARLDAFQELLYAGREHRLLVVLQGMDTSGKDGTIRHLFEGVNPQGVRVACFKEPSVDELDHDYLWRIHQQMPKKGEIVIFNRSHYEDIVTVSVGGFAPRRVWEKRYRHINEFERMLADEDTTILKFFLHIDKKEQKQRLLKRVNDPTKYWKFSAEDLSKRKLWPEYMKAYSRVLSLTSTEHAPWYVIPANKKWYRNLVVAEIIVDALGSLSMKYPPLKVKIDPKQFNA